MSATPNFVGGRKAGLDGEERHMAISLCGGRVGHENKTCKYRIWLGAIAKAMDLAGSKTRIGLGLVIDDSHVGSGILGLEAGHPPRGTQEWGYWLDLAQMG